MPPVVFALPFALYVATLAPGVLNDDPGEYQMVLGALGVAHPTGYPLYTLVGHLFTRVVPFGSIAWRVNLFSAVAGAGACLALYGLLHRLGVQRWIAICVSFLFAISADAWFYATMAQTYALNSLLIVLVLWAFVGWQERHDARSFAVLCLIAGLGVAHHSTFWLLAPGLVIAIVASILPLPNPPPRRNGSVAGEGIALLPALLVGAAAFMLPVSLYLYIPLRGEQLLATPGGLFDIPQAVVSGILTPHYLSGWTNVVAGSFYAGATLDGAAADWGGALTRYAASLFIQFPGLVLLAFGVFDARVWRGRGPFVGLLLVAWVTNVLVVMRGVAAFNEPAGGLYTPTWIFAVVAIGLTSQRIHSGARWRWLVPTCGVVLAGAGMCALLANLGAFVSAPAIAQSGGLHRSMFYDVPTSETLSADVPPGAVMLGAWSPVTPLRYAQIIDGLRPDVAVLQAPLASDAGRDFMLKVVDAGKPLYLLDDTGLRAGIFLPARPQVGVAASAVFGSEIELIGYTEGSLILGDSGPATNLQRIHLFWRAVSRPTKDYKIFIRCAPSGSCAADRPLGSVYFTTSNWRAGQYAEHVATVWPAHSKGALELGLYDESGGQRLALPDGSTTVRIPWH
ncbi:MAG: DUF2723 domain-containing protein [Chloroflexi bacterium]|nr:DUF2723 domain-containing protein [Chloroflexota bacterium]